VTLNKEKPGFTNRENVIPDKEELVYAERKVVILINRKLFFAEDVRYIL
jgi:hypothetical protein